MKSIRCAAALAAAVMLMLAGCGGGGSPTTSDPPPMEEPLPEPPDESTPEPDPEPETEPEPQPEPDPDPEPPLLPELEPIGVGFINKVGGYILTGTEQYDEYSIEHLGQFSGTRNTWSFNGWGLWGICRRGNCVQSFDQRHQHSEWAVHSASRSVLHQRLRIAFLRQSCRLRPCCVARRCAGLRDASRYVRNARSRGMRGWKWTSAACSTASTCAFTNFDRGHFEYVLVRCLRERRWVQVVFPLAISKGTSTGTTMKASLAPSITTA